MEEPALAIFNRISVIGGILVSVLSALLGDHWVLFVGFLLLNIGDYVTGCIKSYIKQTVNSYKGLHGIIKKLGYWIMILLAFGMSVMFVEVGHVIGLNLRITEMIGWFVLSSLIINECLSIIENLVESGYHVPMVLVQGLEIAKRTIASAVPEELEENKTDDEDIEDKE